MTESCCRLIQSWRQFSEKTESGINHERTTTPDHSAAARCSDGGALPVRAAGVKFNAAAMTLEEAQVKIEALERQVFQAEHMNGMLDAQIQKLTEDVRVMTLRNESLQAQIQELQAAPEPTQHSRWLGYKAGSPAGVAVRGAFDMLEVRRWEATKRGNGPETCTVWFRGANDTAVLTEAAFKDFAAQFDAYLKRT
jgi:hypothetical protein